MNRFHLFFHRIRGTNFIHLTTASHNIIPVLRRVKKVGDHYTIFYLMDRIILGPQGRFLDGNKTYVQSWSIHIATEDFQAFYESEPPQATRTDTFEGSLENLSLDSIDFIMERYDLERKVNKPKSTQQEYTGKRLI